MTNKANLQSVAFYNYKKPRHMNPTFASSSMQDSLASLAQSSPYAQKLYKQTQYIHQYEPLQEKTHFINSNHQINFAKYSRDTWGLQMSNLSHYGNTTLDNKTQIQVKSTENHKKSP